MKYCIKGSAQLGHVHGRVEKHCPIGLPTAVVF